METVALHFKYTKAEYVKAEQQYLFASKTITKPSIVILALYLLFSFWYLSYASFHVFSIFCFAMAVLVSVTGCVVYFFMPGYKFKQTSKYHEEYHLTFSKDNIHFKTPTIHSNLKWDVYAEIWESDTFYFLIQAPRLYTLIPKRAFENLASRQSFEALALSNLKTTMRTL